MLEEDGIGFISTHEPIISLSGFNSLSVESPSHNPIYVVNNGFVLKEGMIVDIRSSHETNPITVTLKSTDKLFDDGRYESYYQVLYFERVVDGFVVQIYLKDGMLIDASEAIKQHKEDDKTEQTKRENIQGETTFDVRFPVYVMSRLHPPVICGVSEGLLNYLADTFEGCTRGAIKKPDNLKLGDFSFSDANVSDLRKANKHWGGGLTLHHGVKCIYYGKNVRDRVLFCYVYPYQ